MIIVMNSQSAVADLGRDYYHESLSQQWLSWVVIIVMNLSVSSG